LTIDTHRPIFASTPIGFFEESQIDMMGKRGERQLWRFPGQSRYPLEFR
jgi:hypothetical protein